MWTAKIHELAVKYGRGLDELFDLWSERAAIREYVGGMKRSDAERAAFDELVAMLG